MKHPKTLLFLVLALFCISAEAAVKYVPVLADKTTGQLECVSSNRVYGSIGKIFDRTPMLVDIDADDYCDRVGCVDLDERLLVTRFIRGLKDAGVWNNCVFGMSFSTNHQVSSGSTIYALKGGNATLSGAPGRQSYGFTFDGTATNYLTIPNPYLGSGSITGMTCMVGVKCLTNTAQCIVTGFRSSPNYGFMLSLHGSSTAGNQNNVLVADYSVDGSNTLSQTAGRYYAQHAATGQRQLATATWGPSLYSLQANNDVRGTTSGTFSGIYNPTNTTSWEIGRIYGATGFGINGELAFVLLFNTQLSERQCAIVRRILTSTIATRFLPKNNIVCEGDSLTIGVSSEKVWPKQLVEDATWGPLISKRNIAVSGEGAPEVAAEFPTESAPYAMDQRFGMRNYYVLNIGINETPNKSAATIYAEVTPIWARARALGYTVIACTLLPAQNGANTNVNNTIENARTNFNALVRADATKYDYLADLAAVTVLQDPTNTNYFQADKIHLTTAGHAAYMGKVKASIPVPSAQ